MQRWIGRDNNQDAALVPGKLERFGLAEMGVLLYWGMGMVGRLERGATPVLWIAATFIPHVLKQR
jgi:hypothetical protein